MTGLVSVEEYLATDYTPNAEYEDGVVRPKTMPTYWHSLLEFAISKLIRERNPKLVAAPEQTVRIREGRYLIPDVVAQWRDDIQAPYPTRPVALCVEILSPEDRMSAALLKCEEYHAWGVETTWIVAPESKRAWVYQKGRLPHEISGDGNLEAEGLAVPLASVFAELD